eukprot:gene2317-17949_t
MDDEHSDEETPGKGRVSGKSRALVFLMMEDQASHAFVQDVFIIDDRKAKSLSEKKPT